MSPGMVGQYIRVRDRVAQLVVVPAPLFDLTEVDALMPTERGSGGFGSTGI
jgi:dUTP pyrophosphatase